jgi:hypothetical protein
MIIGNYRPQQVRACVMNVIIIEYFHIKIDVWFMRDNHNDAINMRYINLIFLCRGLIKNSFVAVPETKSPFADLPWHELTSSPFTEANNENVSDTTYIHEPFFDEMSSQVNVTTQLGNDVTLHCKVNDLREKIVSSMVITFVCVCVMFPQFSLCSAIYSSM